jgi:valyl-tRNA synthetase
MLDKTFRSEDVETRLYEQWEAAGCFRGGRKPDAPAFCIVIPPPNVTGNLHIGHALNNTLQDALCRFERMRGKDVLWQPGTDHAGIATQLVVERKLAERQMTRKQMGREKFLEEVWRWKEESGGTIVRQLRRLGASCDWSRERFTMDEGLSRAVLKVFVRLHKEGLIYKDKRLVNWDPRLQTAVSDLEVFSKETKGKLYYIKYPLADGVAYEHPVLDEDGKTIGRETRDYIMVATTRPETMLGDVAVAVHPDDERYKSLVGKKARLPLTERIIPIVADEYSDPAKGTGAVKITPGHDFNDFEVGKRHSLPLINILHPDGTLFLKDNYLFEVASTAYQSDEIRKTIDLLDRQDRFEARKAIVSELDGRGLLECIEDITHAVPHDEKSKEVVLEPYLTEQWYLNVEPLAKKAVGAVETGKTRIQPEQWQRVYFDWLKNIQPWCISRQLWWGHQIPVWYGPRIGNAGEVEFDAISMLSPTKLDEWIPFVAETQEDALEQARLAYSQTKLAVSIAEDRGEAVVALGGYVAGKTHSIKIYRDPDVLDTWFSSALWPFSTLGWPDKTTELARFYPTSVLVTAFDIIFFWVARMMMMGIHFMAAERPGAPMDEVVPFHDVFIHNRVLDEHGQKMSKTKGNVVDPLDLIGEYGADALRFALALAAGHGRDLRLSTHRVETCRNFGTKLWNAARFCEMNECVRKRDFDPASVRMTLNKWIVAETAHTSAAVTEALENYRFNDAAGAIYHFVWDVFCDWYLEFSKPVLNGSDENQKAETRDAAAWAFDRILQLLHPFMPFITEELWARLAEHAEPRRSLLMESVWPELEMLSKHEDACAEMEWLIALISGVRSVRSEMNVPPGARIALVLKDANATTAQRLALHRDLVMTLARLASARTSDAVPAGSAQFVVGEAVAALPLGDVIDLAKERARLDKEVAKAESEIGKIDAKLSNEAFVSRAPEEVIDEQKERRADAAALRDRLSDALKRLSV